MFQAIMQPPAMMHPGMPIPPPPGGFNPGLLPPPKPIDLVDAHNFIHMTKKNSSAEKNKRPREVNDEPEPGKKIKIESLCGPESSEEVRIRQKLKGTAVKDSVFNP